MIELKGHQISVFEIKQNMNLNSAWVYFRINNLWVTNLEGFSSWNNFKNYENIFRDTDAWF